MKDQNQINISQGNNKTLVYVVIGVIALVIVGIVLFKLKDSGSVTTNVKTDLKPIALTEIATHNSKSSCWTTINGGVYDVTNFISKHEGGDRILNACGIDATDLFTGKSPMGRLHSQVAVRLLSSMQIGTLQK